MLGVVTFLQLLASAGIKYSVLSSESKKKSKTKSIVIILIIAIVLFSCLLSTLIPIIVGVSSKAKNNVERPFAQRLVDEGVVGRWKDDIVHGVWLEFLLEHEGGKYSMKITTVDSGGDRILFDWVFVNKEELEDGFRFTTISTIQRTPTNINGSFESFKVDNEGNLSGDGLDCVKY